MSFKSLINTMFGFSDFILQKNVDINYNKSAAKSGDTAFNVQGS